MPDWTAEVVVDEALARRLIEGQFPEIETAWLALLAEGWDNTVWVVNDSIAFRLPRREVAIPGIRREMSMLPALAPLLPLPVPIPKYLGHPAAGYPWPFFGYTLLPGREPAGAGLTDEGLARLARPLGAFLRRLHSAEVREAIGNLPGLPADPMGRADMGKRVPMARKALAEVRRLGLWSPPAEVFGTLDSAGHLAAPTATGVAHGDLHLRHVLIGTHGDLAAVIDWGDVCQAHPAVDMVLYWSLLPQAGRAEFLAAYGPVSEEALLRGRVLSFFLCAVLAVHAHSTGASSLERESVAGLRRTALDF